MYKSAFDSYNATVARYESDPSTGDGKQELLQTAQTYADRCDRAARQNPNFDYARALYHIAIVLGSVSIVAMSRRLLPVALVLGGIATLLMLDGFVLVVELPGGQAPVGPTGWSWRIARTLERRSASRRQSLAETDVPSAGTSSGSVASTDSD